MFRHTALGLVAALAFVAAPVAAEPFESFSDLCLAANANRDEAGALAKGAGWTVLPTAGVDFGGEIHDAIVFLSVDPATMTDKGPSSDLEVMFTGWGAGEDIFKVAGVRLDACAVLSPTGDAEALKAQMGALVGGPPMAEGDTEMWLFSRSGDRFIIEKDVASLDESQLRRVADERKLYVVVLMVVDDMVGLMLGALRQSE